MNENKPSITWKIVRIAHDPIVSTIGWFIVAMAFGAVIIYISHHI